MPIYTSEQNVKSGLPLGGVGAGKIEIFPSGVLDNFTFLNNIHSPLSAAAASGSTPGILGFHFAIFVKDRTKKVAKLLQARRVGCYPGVEGITFDAAYPVARLQYEDEELPVKVELEAWSPFIRGDEKNSGLPLAFFRFRVTNRTAHAVAVSLMGVVRNIIGIWGVGRFNQVVETDKTLALCCHNKKTQIHDPAAGEMALVLFKERRGDVSYGYLGEWNMQARPFVFDETTLTLGEAWASFAEDGTLPCIDSERVVQAESQQLGGAVSLKTELGAKSSVGGTFALAWHFPNYGEGHMYETWFRNVGDVVAYAAEKRVFLEEATREGVKAVRALKVEGWLKDALLNNLYPLVSGALWTKRGRFGVFEAPVACPLLGTLDVRFYGSLPLSLFFPNLELKEMMQFADAQRPQGYIPHDLGFKRSDLASNSTNGLFWKDLNSKFILLIWRDYLFTQDEVFLRRMYPFVKKAFYWLVSTDKNKDFLPDNEGADQTFDLWSFYGAGAYTSGIFLAALLALEKIAAHLQDGPLRQEAISWFKKGRASFEKKLWHKKYFIAYNSLKEGMRHQEAAAQAKFAKTGTACMAAQLAGQWAAHLLGLGYIASPDKIKTAVATILELNAGSAFGAVNAVTATRERDKTNLQSQHIWFGMTYCLAALAIYEGFEREGLELAKKAWDNAVSNVMNPWNQPDMYSSTDGSFLFGDHYMRNMVVWSLLFALAKKDKHVDHFLAAFMKKGDRR